MKHLPVMLVALLAAACGSQPDRQSQSAESAAAAQAAPSNAERFYGRERFTIVGTQSGMESGGWTEHVREWGRRRAEIREMTVSVMGISRQTQTRVVFTGPEVATVNLQTGGVTVATNPLYDQVVQAMRGRDGVEFGATVMTSMGGRATGERARFAGEECEYWELTGLGTRSCVTPWGATLHTVTSVAGVTVERTATEVRMGDGGPDAAFQYDATQATRAPSLEDIRAKMRGGN